MKWNKKIRVACLSLLLVLGAVVSLYHTSQSEGKGSGQALMASMGISRISYHVKAPDFALEDLEGKTARLSDHRGKVVLVSFWTTW